jgi:hypothetical protein
VLRLRLMVETRSVFAAASSIRRRSEAISVLLAAAITVAVKVVMENLTF